MSFEEIEHTADRAFRVQGRNFEELLENAARAMSSLNRLGPSGEPSAVRTIEVEGIVNTATLPGVIRHAIAMPDIHQGYGFPIGGGFLGKTRVFFGKMQLLGKSQLRMPVPSRA